MATENESEDKLNKARDKKTASTLKGAKALDSLTSSAMKAAGAIYTTLPKSLTDIFGDKALGGALNYLERNLELMRGFSTYGVDFGNQVDQMIISATASRIGLDGFSKIVGQSGSDLLMFGVTANQGLQQFIKSQTDFFKNFEEEERTLKRLGYTVDEITNTFLVYDKISNYARVRTGRTEEERNRAAVEFSIELDKMSKLTGKQREALAEQMIEVSRAGDVQARANQLTTEAGKQSLKNSVTLMKQFSPGLGKLAQDVLSSGIPKSRETKQIAGLAKDYYASLLELREAQERGNKEEIAAAEERVRIEAQKAKESETIQSLAIFSGVNAYTDIASQLLYDLASGPAKAYEVAKAQLVEEGKAFTDSDVIARVRENIAKEQGKAITDAEKGTQRIQQAMIDALTVAQKTAAEAQISGTQKVFEAMSGPISSFSGLLTQLDLPKKIEQFNDFFNKMINGLGNIVDDKAAQGLAAATEAMSRGSNELSRELLELSRKFNEATGPEKVALGQQLSEAMKKAYELPPRTNLLVNAEGVTIIPDQTFIEGLSELLRNRGSLPNPEPEAEGRDTGSLGKTGRLFENFGKQSNMLLHGIESVQTPEQTAEIMRHSAIGTAQAFADSLRGQQGMEVATYIKSTVVPAMEQMSGTTLQSVNGMLNTLRTATTSNNNNVQNQTFDMATMEQLFSKLASNVKGPMEEALKGLRGPMEEFASTAREQLSIQQKQLKGIKGINGDALRGLG